MIDELPPAKQLLGDKGYDSDEFRKALVQPGISPCIPHLSNRKTKSMLMIASCTKNAIKPRIGAGKLKDWRV